MNTSLNIFRLLMDTKDLKIRNPHKKIICILFIDFKSAFDSVDQNLYFKKMS